MCSKLQTLVFNAFVQLISELGGGVTDLSSPEFESDDEPPPQEINRNNLQQIDVDEIQLSQKQRITSELAQLETKAKLLHSEAKGSNAALYYVEKAMGVIDNMRNNLDDSERKINSKLQLIDQLLTKAEKIVQEST